MKLTAFPGAVVLEAGDGDDARGLEVVPALFDGAPFSVSCAPAYLLDGLSALGQRFAAVNITTPTKPLVLTGHRSPRADDGDGGYRYLTMPLRAPSGSTRQDRHLPGSAMDLGRRSRTWPTTGPCARPPPPRPPPLLPLRPPPSWTCWRHRRASQTGPVRR